MYFDLCVYSVLSHLCLAVKFLASLICARLREVMISSQQCDLLSQSAELSALFESKLVLALC